MLERLSLHYGKVIGMSGMNGAVSGMCRVLILPARNLTPIEYPSGLWHHDRCGRRIKCFVFLEK